MRNAEMIDYLDSVVAPSSPHLRGADILDPLWATDSHRATQRERVLRLCSDYGSGAEERRSGRPVDVEALPMGYRLYAYMLLHRAIFSPTFFNNIRKAINIETPVSMSRVQDTPFILQRLPELDSGLTSEYALEWEKSRLGAWAKWRDAITNIHHHVPHSMGGVDMAPNTVELPRKFHSHIHLLSRNLPPHLGLIALVAWSGLDDRRFARHGQAVAGVYDVLRDIGRDRYADIGSIYRPEAIHSGAVGTSSTSKRAKEKIYGTGVLRHSIRIGARW